MSPTLYWFPVSPFARVVRYFLIASNIEHDLKLIDIIKGEQKTPEYTAINPMQKVPALVDGDLKLNESYAIIRYLAMKYDTPLLPFKSNLNAAAKIDAQATYIAGGLAKTIYGLVYEKVFKLRFGGTPDESVIVKSEAELVALLTKANELYFNESEFAVENQFSLVDILLAVAFAQSRVIRLNLSAFPKLDDFYNRVSQQDSFKAAHKEFFGFLASQGQN